MFSPRLRPLKGHDSSYGSCKMNRIYCVQSSTDECKYKGAQMIITILSIKQQLNNIRNMYEEKGLLTFTYLVYLQGVNRLHSHQGTLVLTFPYTTEYTKDYRNCS